MEPWKGDFSENSDMCQGNWPWKKGRATFAIPNERFSKS